MKYDLNKVRVACLKLIGWHDSFDYSPNFESPNGTRISWAQLALGDFGSAPNPTTSLDDALPLMEKFTINLTRSFALVNAGWEADAACGESPELNYSAPLAVCLCALRCAGRDLKEFEASS